MFLISRYEGQFENGVAHFFEHMAFKGTCSRSKAALTDQMSCTGARFSCFTTREMVGYYAECLNEDVPVITDILADCIFNNCLSPSEIENQKQTVYLEMLKHDQDENEVLFDYLHVGSFMGTPLGQTVMGPSSNLYNFCDGTISRYIEKMFDPTRIVLVAVGGITHEQVVQLAVLYLSHLEPLNCVDPDICRYTAGEVTYRHDGLPYANIALAFEAPGFCDIERYPMEVAAALMGGWDESMPAGWNDAHRLSRAATISKLCRAYKGFYLKYKDVGLWGVQFMVPMTQTENFLYNVQNEWMKLCTMVTDVEVDRAKREYKTKILTRTESALGTCYDIGRWTLYHGCRPQIHERIAAIGRVNCDDVREACSKFVYDKCVSVAAVGPTECLPTYQRLRAGQYWLRY